MDEEITKLLHVLYCAITVRPHQPLLAQTRCLPPLPVQLAPLAAPTLSRRRSRWPALFDPRSSPPSPTPTARLAKQPCPSRRTWRGAAAAGRTATRSGCRCTMGLRRRGRLPGRRRSRSRRRRRGQVRARLRARRAGVCFLAIPAVLLLQRWQAGSSPEWLFEIEPPADGDRGVYTSACARSFLLAPMRP